jgi:hypothetical protein
MFAEVVERISIGREGLDFVDVCSIQFRWALFVHIFVSLSLNSIQFLPMPEIHIYLPRKHVEYTNEKERVGRVEASKGRGKAIKYKFFTTKMVVQWS